VTLADFAREFRPLPTQFTFHSDNQKSLFDYMRNVTSRKWTVAAVFLAGVALAGLRAYTAVPVYVSTATVEIEKAGPMSRNMDDLMSAFGQFDIFFQTQIETLKSRGLAETFLKRTNQWPGDRGTSSSGNSGPRGAESTASAPKEVERPNPPGMVAQIKSWGTNVLSWVGLASPIPASGGTAQESKSPAGDASPDAQLADEQHKIGLIDGVLARVRVNAVPRTQLIEVDMRANDPLVAKQILTTYLNTFVEQSQRKRVELTTKVRTWLKNELTEAQKQLAKSQQDLLDFTGQHGIVFFDKRGSDAVAFHERASETFLRSKSDRVNLEAATLAKSGNLPEEMSGAYVDNLRNQLKSLQSQYADMKAIYSPNYFKMTLLRNKIKKIEETIGDIEKRNLGSELEAAKKKEESSEQVYEKTKLDAVKSNSLTVQYEILKKSVESDFQVYMMLLQKSKQAELDQGVMGYTVEVVNPASLPTSPVYPRTSKILLLGALFGMMAGIGVALCLEFFDDTARTTQEIRRRVNVPILGALPKIDRLSGGHEGMGTNGTPPEFQASKFPLSPFTDAVRIVENGASSVLQAEMGCILCISSAIPMEGKTFLAVSLGSVIASEGKRVLVIDGDMRKGRIHEVFKTHEHGSGLSDVISGKSSELRNAIRESGLPGLYYMPSGPTPDNPVALIKAPRMQALLETVKREFDCVILDSPPVLGVVDARILCGYADGLILVTRAGHTPIDMLVQAREAVSRGDNRLLGIVLNMSDPRVDGYSHYYSGKYGRYYNRYYHSRRYHSSRPAGSTV